MNSPKILTVIFAVLLFPATLFAQENLQELASTLGAQLNKHTVAVVGFSCSNGETQPASSIIQERLITFLANKKNITVVERNKLDTIFNEHALQMSGAVDADSAKSLGKLLAADIIITGSFAYITSKQIEVNARAIDAKTGKIIATANATLKKDWQGNDGSTKDIPNNISQKAAEYFKSGMQYYNQGKYSMAIEFFTRAIAQNNEFANAYLYRGIANYKKGKYDNAMQDYNKAIEINPELSQAYFHRALSYKFITIDYNKAFNDFEKAIELSPTSIGYWISRAEAYWAKKEYKKAISDCNKAIEIDPEHAAEAYVMRDAIYKEMNKKR